MIQALCCMYLISFNSQWLGKCSLILHWLEEKPCSWGKGHAGTAVRQSYGSLTPGSTASWVCTFDTPHITLPSSKACLSRWNHTYFLAQTVVLPTGPRTLAAPVSLCLYKSWHSVLFILAGPVSQFHLPSSNSASPAKNRVQAAALITAITFLQWRLSKGMLELSARLLAWGSSARPLGGSSIIPQPGENRTD